MKRFYFVLIALLALIIAGCGGGGSSSQYEGVYSGTYATSSETGTVDMTIDQNGDVSGTTVANSSGVQTRMNGHIQNNGDITGDFFYNGGVDDPFGGFLDFDTNGDLTGTLNITTSSGVVHAHFVLQRTSFKRNKPAVQPKTVNPNAKPF